MNKTRQKAIAKIAEKAQMIRESFEETASTLHGQLAELKEEIEGLRDAEQESYDNLSEKAQDSEKGQASQDSINEMESAVSEADTLMDTFDAEELFRDFIGALEAAANMEA